MKNNMKTVTIVGADAVIKSQPTLVNWGTMDHIITGPEAMSVSDGYHTLDELYDHRITLYIALAKRIRKTGDDIYVWRSKHHSDGELCFGTGTQFVLGLHVENGEQIIYHIPVERWDETDFANTLEIAPEFDGHTSADVLQRLKDL